MSGPQVAPGGLALASQPNTFTKTQTIKLGADGDGLSILAAANGSGHQALRLSDLASDGGGGASNAGPMIAIFHEGGGNALDISNRSASTQLALAVHHYQSTSAGVQFDNVGSQTLLRLKNAENPSAVPGVHGTGAFLTLQGYYAPGDTFNTGVVTGGNTVTDTTNGAFVPEDVGKPVTVGLVSTTIATVPNSTSFTTVSNALVNASGVSYSYVGRNSANNEMLSVAQDLTLTLQGRQPLTIKTAAGAATALAVQQPSGASKALFVTNNGTGIGAHIQQFGNNQGLFVENNASAANQFLAQFQANKNGVSIVVGNDSGNTLFVQKTSAGAGVLATLDNRGTGVSLDVKNGGGSLMQIDNAGNIVSTTTGIKIATAASQKLGFFNAAPVAQQSAGVAASDATTTQALANQLRTSLIALGLVA